MAVNFPAKIYQILENESPEIIRWHSNGCAFRIVDHGRFEREIIPKYFRHNQLSSVQRQLNLYGFKCVSRGEDKGAFFHPLFKRGDWEVVKKITRFVPGKKGSDDAAFPSNNNNSSTNGNSVAVAPKTERGSERERQPGGERHPFNNNVLHARSPAVAHAVTVTHTAAAVLPNAGLPPFRSPFDPYGFFESHALAPGMLAGVQPPVLPAVHPNTQHNVHPAVCTVPSWSETHSLSLSDTSSLAALLAESAHAASGEAEEDVVRAYPRSGPVSSERKQRAIAKARTRQLNVVDAATDGATDSSPASPTESPPCGKEGEKERAAQKQREAARPFVFVVQDAVTIDPDFDLDDDLLLFDDAHHLAPPRKLDSTHPVTHDVLDTFHVSFPHNAHAEKRSTREVGVNTDNDLSLVCPHCRK